ncbi:MAG: DUF6512 family protein [Pseudomonadota bacterium]
MGNDVRFALSGAVKWCAFVSAVIVIACGSMLHFAWEWSDRSPLVAVFAATNESTWEHLKLAFWPALALAPIHRVLYGPAPGWLTATTVRCVLPPFLIVVMFYGYTGLSGAHYLVADLAIFAVAIMAGELLGHAILAHEFGPNARRSSLALLLLATLLFSTLTFNPPDFFLFQAPPLP